MSVRTDPAGGATIAIRSVHAPQSLHNRLTSVTVGNDSIHINVDPPLDTDTNNDEQARTALEATQCVTDDGHAQQASFYEYLTEQIKKKKTSYMPDELYRHLWCYISDPQYINSSQVSDAMRAKLSRHTKAHRYGIVQRDVIDDDGKSQVVAVLAEYPSTKLQRKRNVYMTAEPLQVVPLSDVEKVLRRVHVTQLGHAGQDATWCMMSSTYANIPRDWCREYCARCRVCAIRTRKVHKTPTQSNSHSSHIIQS
jgi:hypothetical protein